MTEVSRFFQNPGSSFFLFGPRGTGKSTWLRAAFPEALWLDLLEPDLERELSARPERLRQLVEGAPKAQVVVVDEVQRAPAVLTVVHQLIEQKRRGRRFVLTGSSARKLKRAEVDLLGGRALRCTMHPFMAAELGRRFDLGRALREGLVPGVWAAAVPKRTLASYVALYVREEVKSEGLIRNLGAFSRFLEAISFSHAAVLNLSNVARECEVRRTTAEGYLEVLEDLLLAYRVPVFSRRAKRILTHQPKLYWFDAGVFRSVRPSGPLDRPEEIEGAALEGLVAQHLRAWIDYGSADATLQFWRTKSGNEVDFVVYGRDGFWAIEVKNSASVRPEDLRGLRAFHEDYPQARLALLYRGGRRLRIDGVSCLPCEEFLSELRPGRDLPI
jgi:predicted AAA+ superfamily ATPase